MVSKILKSLQIVGLLITSKYGLFSNFQHGLRISQSTTDVLTVVSDTIAKSSNRDSGYSAVAYNISMAFYMTWLFFTNLNLSEF